MAREYDVESMMGNDYEFELSPEILAFEMSMDFADQVIRRCDEIGIGLNELASRMNVSASTLSEKLNGQNLTLKSIASMAIALSCDVVAPELVVDTTIKYSMNDKKWSFSEVPMSPDQAMGYAPISFSPKCGECSGTKVNKGVSPKSSYQFKNNYRKAAA